MDTISTKALAALSGLTARRIQQLAASGVIEKGARGFYPHPGAIQAIIAHHGEIAAGRGGEDEQADLAKERALLARSQREGHDLKNQALKKNLVPADAVEREWAGILSLIRGRLLGLPQDLAQLLPHLTKADLDTFDRAIRDALEELSNGS